MANNILLKKSSVAAKVPTTGDLDYGELALNYADGALYYKTASNTIARLNPLEADTLATVTGRGATTSTAITVGGLTSNGIAEFKSNVGFSTATLNPTVQLQYGSTWNNGRLQILNGPTTMWEFGPSAVTSNATFTIAAGNFNVSSGSATVSGDITAGGLFRVSDGQAIRCTNTGPSGVFYLDSPTITWRNPNTAYSTLAQLGVLGLSIAPTTASTTTSNGALVVSGGVGVAGAINAGGAVTTTGLTVNGASSLAGDVTNVDSISFDLTAAEATGIGKLYWDAGIGELRYGLGGGNVEVAIGQTQVTYVRNAETSTITKGQVVYLFGAQGDRPSVKLASNTSDTTSNKTFGIAAENIAANSDGYVINTGILSGVDTSAYTPGDILWLGSTAGTYTTTKAVAPNHLVFIGVVVKANQGGGQIYVKPQNGYELDEIHDVLISGIGLNHSLFYDTSVNVWKNYAPSAARTNLGLGTIATQNANSVAITGGAIDGTPVGATTPSTGKFTTLQTTGDATIGGNLTVSGTTTTVNAQNLNITDNLFYLNAGSTNTNPDIGFAANYNDGTYRHAGFFRDATDGYWKVFKNYTPEPDASIYIDTSHASFALADIQAANFRGALVGNATTASTLAGTPTINGVTFNGGSNITITSNTTNALTIGDGLSGTSFNGSAAVTIAVDSTVARRADVTYVGTTSIALNRTSAAQTLTGINGLTAVGTNQSITLTPTGTGGVAIGTASAAYPLHVYSSGQSTVAIETSGRKWGMLSNTTWASNGLSLYDLTGDVSRLFISTSGNIGVGTTNPTTKFHISGGNLLVDAFNVGDENGIFFRDGFASPGNYNCSILVKDHNGSSPDGISINGYDGVSICTGADTRNERMRVAQNGNVGIGTTSPSYKLHAYAASGTVAYFATPGGGDVKFTNGVIDSNSSQFGLKADAGNKAYLGANNAQHLTIDISGNVGIGTTSPTAKVDVYGGASATPQTYILARAGSFTTVLGAQDSAGVAQESFVGSLTNNDFKFKTNSTEYMRLTAAGNFGIGTASPSQKLEVTGNIKLTNGGYIYGDGANAQLHLSNALGSQLIYGSVAVRALAASVKLVATSEEISLVNNNGSVWLSGAGNVGIGITGPSTKLHVYGADQRMSISTSTDSASITIGQWDGTTNRIESSTRKLFLTSYAGGISLGASGSEHLHISTTGNVGVGTSSPSQKLHISGGNLLVNNNASGDTNSGIRIVSSIGTTHYNWMLAAQQNVNAAFEITPSTAVGGTTFSSPVAVFLQSGNVGIGTTTPASKLDVNGISTLRDTINIGPSIGVISWGSMGGGTGFGIRSESGRALSLGANAAWDYLVINTSGNVGIGTAFPSYKLHVMGDARMGANGQRLYFFDDGNAHIHSTSTPLWINAEDNTSNIYINHQYNGGVILTKAGGGNVGIGEGSPTQKLHVAGNARITGALYDSANSAGTSGQVLTSTGTGTAWSSTGAAVTGTGTTGKIAKWSATTALADSVITESSGNIGIDTTPTQKLDVNGNIGWNTDYVLSSSTITTTSTTANQVIASVSATTYRTFKFVIQAVDATAGKYQSQEIMAVHNGSTVAHTEYTAINVGGAVATYDVDISGSNVRLLCTPLSANGTVFKVSMQLIKV